MSIPDIRVSQLNIIKHSLGLDRPDYSKKLAKFNRDKKQTSWEENNRNHFCVSSGSMDHKSILELVDLGLMEGGTARFGSLSYFVTDQGKKMVGIIIKQEAQ